ncbi:MAG TPA: FG-GAP-like repeat-containing protein [Thermoanaerobaculia bacterium]|nr:FG-GAP-like repeat-containing protein [Thermoanaerobaculia bacterium]
MFPLRGFTAAISLSIFLTLPLTAATFNVNSTTDAVDANPGNGTCADSLGNCTLRAAIMEANALAGTDDIVIPANTYTLTIAGGQEDVAATGDLDITQSVNINGAAAATTIVDGNQLDRVFDIVSGTVSMTGLTARNGKLIVNTDGFGGGVRNAGTLTMTSCAVSDNTIFFRGTPSDGRGGGIWNSGTLNIDLSTISVNFIDVGQAAATNEALGGGIFNSGSLTINRTTIATNTAQALWDSFTQGSLAHPYGGGIYNQDTASANLVMTASTISGNHASTRGAGGGLYLGNTATLTNCTISGNSCAIGGPSNPSNAGAILKAGGALQTYTNVTITNNTANTINADISAFNGNANFANSIVDETCSGTITSLGYNLFGTSCSAVTTTGDQTGLASAAFGLGTLQNNGGTTETHALNVGSPAIDAASPTTFPATDQRGAARPTDGNGDAVARADSGAFERCGTPAITGPTVANSGDNVILNATAGGSSYQWYRGGVAIGGATTSSLALNGVTPLNAGGIYTVAADFGCGSQLSAEFVFSVRHLTFDNSIFWRHAVNGWDYIWLMNGATITNSFGLATVPDTNWWPWGYGDLNGDGVFDLVWQHFQTQQIYLWFMNANGTLNVAQPLSPPFAGNWTVKAVADFDGDGRADILAQQGIGGEPRQNFLWLMNGGVIRETRQLPTTPEPSSWNVYGVGDLDGDGIADIVWNFQPRSLQGWIIRGGVVTQNAFISSYPDGWGIHAVGDADLDGKADFIWRNTTTGQTYFWKMNGLAITTQQPMLTASGWEITAAGDYDHDGRLDLLWTNASGAKYIWFLNGASIASAGPLQNVPDMNWVMAAPKANIRP